MYDQDWGKKHTASQSTYLFDKEVSRSDKRICRRLQCQNCWWWASVQISSLNLWAIYRSRRWKENFHALPQEDLFSGVQAIHDKSPLTDTMFIDFFNYPAFKQPGPDLGLITSRCSGKEPVLLPRGGTQTRHERAVEIKPRPDLLFTDSHVFEYMYENK